MKIDRHELIFLIDLPCEIEASVQIWHNVHVMPGAKIGAQTSLGEGTHVGKNVTIGERCRIQNGAQLFDGVTIADDVFIGPHAVFTNVLTPRAFVDRRHAFKKTLVERGVSIGANATILCGITIGEYAMIGAGSVVTKAVQAHSLVYGNPARLQGWVCTCGWRMRGWFNNIGEQQTCPDCTKSWESTCTGIVQT